MLIPEAPINAVIDPIVQTLVTSVMAFFAVIALACSVFYWIRSGRPTLLMLFLAGGSMMLMEPFVDLVGGCWHPANAWHVFTAYGRPMPVWLCLCYFFYFGIGVGVTWLLMRRGLSHAQLWGIFISNIIGDMILEMTLLHFDTYIYYGWQPLVMLKFPLWWAPANSLISVVAAMIVYRGEKMLMGWKQILIVPISMSTYAGVAAATSWPSWLVINTDAGWVMTQIGGLTTFGLSIWFMSVLAPFAARPGSSK